MPRTRSPRAGSMQFWPRVRSRERTARVRTWPKSQDAKPLGFAGYKVGMTHLLVIDNNQHSLTKAREIFCPITVVECPPLKAASIKFYKNSQNISHLVSEVFADNVDKELEGVLTIPKKKGKEAENFDFVRLLCYTQPKLISIGKKIPELFEVALGGNKEQQLRLAKEKIGKEINISEVFKEGQQLDVHAITKGKGFQGPVKRFGITLRQHKSEKSRRNPGTLGAWRAQGHIMWRTAHAGKMGYHLRTEYNKQLIKIGSKPEEINAKGGFVDYGLIKSQYILIRGSMAGAKKRLVRFTEPIRPNKSTLKEAPQIAYVSTDSKQGR